jgi:hypothetical protein
MKKNVLKLTGRAFLTAAFFTLISAQAFSHVTTNSQIIGNTTGYNKMEIKVLKIDAEKILLSIKMQNPQGSRFTLFVTDEDGNELFSKEYTNEELNASVTLVRFDNINSYKIGIRSSNRQLEQNYSIVPTVKYISDVVIKKQ